MKRFLYLLIGLSLAVSASADSNKAQVFNFGSPDETAQAEDGDRPDAATGDDPLPEPDDPVAPSDPDSRKLYREMLEKAQSEGIEKADDAADSTDQDDSQASANDDFGGLPSPAEAVRAAQQSTGGAVSRGDADVSDEAGFKASDIPTQTRMISLANAKRMDIVESRIKRLAPAGVEDRFDKRIAAVDQQLNNHAQGIDWLNDSIKAIRDYSQRVAADISGLRDDITQANARMDGFETSVIALNDTYEADLEAMTQKREALREQVSQAREAAQQHHDDLDSEVKANRRQMVRVRDNITQRANELDTALESLVGVIADTRSGALSGVAELLAQRDDRIDRLSSKLDRMASKNDTLMQANENALVAMRERFDERLASMKATFDKRLARIRRQAKAETAQTAAGQHPDQGGARQIRLAPIAVHAGPVTSAFTIPSIMPANLRAPVLPGAIEGL